MISDALQNYQSSVIKNAALKMLDFPSYLGIIKLKLFENWLKFSG
jgi:hypothetical protein